MDGFVHTLLMAGRGRPRALLTVSAEEREVLVRWSKRPTAPHSIAQRARIVLLAADGLSNKEVADKVGCNQATVVKWRKRFIEHGLEGLPDDPRPGAPRSITDDDVEAVIVRTLEDRPTDATQWSTRDLAAKSGMSASSVGRIWRAFGLKPWLTDTFKLSEDPQFVDKVRDVVGLYMNPPDHAVVLCVDEKTSIQALDRTQPSLPMRPGQVERRTHDYKRNGVTDLFAALNLATGQVLAQTRRQHRAVEFRQFLDAIDAAVPDGLDVHIVLLAEPRRALVRRAHPQAAATLRPPLRRRPDRRPQRLGRPMERRPQALHLAQDRRRDPRHPQQILNEPMTQDTRRSPARLGRGPGGTTSRRSR